MSDKIKLNPMVKNALLILVLLIIFLIVAIPFKVMSVIQGFTDIRPVMLLQPVYGVFFGIPGCIAFAIGNLIGDIVSDSLRWSSIAGFAANFLGTFVFYYYWSRLSKTPFSLRTGRNLLKQIAVIFVSAMIQTIIITPAVELVYPEVTSRLFAVTVLLNNSAFPIMLGIPLMILMQEELGFKPKVRLTTKQRV
ncbi:MAG: hypothetical protein UH734_01485 [Ruminococcus sp.]|nr:hypothetical protein [Ruminococcus sp.]